MTIPHKENTYRLVTAADETTERLGAVNTVFVREGKVFGTNTDGEGFINSLYQSAPGLSLRNARAVVIGAGGASLAVVNAILEQGAAEVAVANRTIEKVHAATSALRITRRAAGLGAHGRISCPSAAFWSTRPHSA